MNKDRMRKRAYAFVVFLVFVITAIMPMAALADEATETVTVETTKAYVGTEVNTPELRWNPDGTTVSWDLSKDEAGSERPAAEITPLTGALRLSAGATKVAAGSTYDYALVGSAAKDETGETSATANVSVNFIGIHVTEGDKQTVEPGGTVGAITVAPTEEVAGSDIKYQWTNTGANQWEGFDELILDQNTLTLGKAPADLKQRTIYTFKCTPNGDNLAAVEVPVTVEAGPTYVVTVSPKTALIAAGSSTAFTAGVTKDGVEATVDDAKVSWSSSNENVATVNENGTVTGVAAGTATITATCEADSTVSDTATINVGANLSLTADASTVTTGNTVDITAVVKLGAATSADAAESALVTWESSDATIATVTAGPTSTCTVTGVKVGTATIAATYVHDGISLTQTQAITVRDPVVEVQISPPSVALAMGDSTTVAKLTPSMTVDGKAVSGIFSQWSVESPDLGISITSQGITAGQVAGSTTVKAVCSHDGATGTAIAPVKVLDTTSDGIAVSVSGPDTVEAGSSIQLVAAVTDNGAVQPNPCVAWNVKQGASAAGVKVSSEGVVSAGATVGKATIIATFGTKSAEKEVTVTPLDPSVVTDEVVIKGPSSVQTGDEINITVTTTAHVFSGKIGTTGLMFCGVTEDIGCNDKSVRLGTTYGRDSVTYTYEVVGEAGTSSSFELQEAYTVNINTEVEKLVNVAPWRTIVGGSASSSQYAVSISGPNTVEAGGQVVLTATLTPPPGQSVPSGVTYDWSVTGDSGAVGITSQSNKATVSGLTPNTSAVIRVTVQGLGTETQVSAMHTVQVTSATAPPTVVPTESPTTPTGGPTTEPTGSPTTEPTGSPVITPTKTPTSVPTNTPSQPSYNPPQDPGTVNPPSATLSTAPSSTPNPGASDSPSSRPSSNPTDSPSKNPVSPIPDSPIDFEVVDNPVIGGDAIEGVEISNTGNAPSVADLLTFSDLPSGAVMTITTPQGVAVAWNTPVSTGQIVTVRDMNDNIISQATVVVKGDVLGIGRINLAQLVRMAEAFRGTNPLSGAFLVAGKWTSSSDNQSITLTDLVKEAQLYRATGMRPGR